MSIYQPVFIIGSLPEVTLSRISYEIVFIPKSAQES